MTARTAALANAVTPRPQKASDGQDDSIDRTPEYIQFMQALEELHLSQGTVLQREPVLGGKNLDLLKIYTMVIEAGGYEQVTHERGWKKIGIPFDLPTTCTNSAFVFKQIYQKYLYCYELIHFQTHRSSITGPDGLPPGVVVRAPSAIPLVPTVAAVPPRIDVHGFPGVNDRMAKRARFEMPVSSQPQLNLSRQKASNTQLFQMNFEEDEKDEKHLCGGWQNRLALALKSELPNEVDWAYNKLVKISFEHSFYIGFIPNLPEILVEHMQPFFDQLILNTSPFNFETTLKCGMPGSVSSPIDTTDAELGMVVPHLEAQPFESEDFHITSLSGISMFASQACQTLQERVHQTLHIIRNLSFMPENALAFSKDHRMLTLFAKAIALPADTIYVEIKQYALEIYENLASFIILRGQNDFYLTCLKQMLFENDRGRVVGSLRCMIRLTMTEANEKSIMGIETSIIQRLIQLLLIPDEEIISGVMEFLYLFSGLGSEIGVRIMQCVRFNVLRLFLKFLEWKGVGKVSTHVHGSSAPPIAANTSSVAAPGAALASRPTTPAMAVPFTPALQRPPAYLDPRAIDHFQAAIWLQGILEADATYAIHQVGLMNEYEAYCKMTNLKALQLPELIKLIQNIFVGSTSRDHASAPGVTIINGVIKGIRPRLNTTASTSTHLVNVMSHLHHIFPEANDELRGIPLSAVLVLRNIARHPDNREFFSPFEGDLAQLMLLPRFNKVVGTILAELKG